MADVELATVRELGATVRAVLWPGAIVLLAVLFRRSLAALLARASAISVSSPLGGVSIAAHVAGLLGRAEAGRRTGAVVLWIDDRPEGGAAERAALAVVGIPVLRLPRAADAVGRLARAMVFAGHTADAADRDVLAGAAALLVLYPDPGAGATLDAGPGVVVCRDPLALFATVAALF